MMTRWLGVNLIANSLITTHLLAVVSVYFLAQTERFAAFVGWLERTAPNSFLNRHARWVAYLFTGILLATGFNLLGSGDIALAQSLRVLLFTGEQLDQPTIFLTKLLTALGILVLAGLFPIVSRLFARLETTLESWRHTRFRMIKIQNLELLTPDQLANLVIVIARYLRLAVHLLLGSAVLTMTFSLMPWTEGLAHTLWETVADVGASFWESFLAFLPDLVTLVAIAVVARFALKVLRFFYEGLQQGKIRYAGIHAELVEPTYQILRFLVIASALVAAFPYIPGSDSPVFRGLSIFVGFLLSLGSTSLVANIVAGIVLTYSRGLKIGDRVALGDSVGDVTERTLLVVRLRTIKNVIITIPNAVVLQKEIVNYSAEAADEGLILHTSVTIGYDVPWRQVQALLIAAARQTPKILRDPAPFVLKTSLDDYYITYELNAFTGEPACMAVTYSNLHQNILDQFNDAEVEILSPAYMAIRDGDGTTIPETAIKSK